MAASTRAQTPKIRQVRLTRRQPAVSVADLALMLEIDLSFGCRDDFRKRLQRALEDAHRQGMERNRRAGLSSDCGETIVPIARTTRKW